ncbi:MAG: M23 family metallopeptidase, partial [Nanoarchaeota archaeon]
SYEGLPLSEIPSRPVIIEGGSGEGGLSIFSPDDHGNRDERGWPVENPIITSCYGARSIGDKWHDGLDFGVPVGTSIHSINDGSVYATCEGRCHGYGNNIIIQHDDGTYTRYNHLSELKVKRGDPSKPAPRVTKGQIIALSGNTGVSTGAHLHLSVFYSNDFTHDLGKGSYDRDPLLYLPALHPYKFTSSRNCKDSPTVQQINREQGSSNIQGGVQTTTKLNTDVYLEVDDGSSAIGNLELKFEKGAWQWRVHGDDGYLSVNLPDNENYDYSFLSVTREPDEKFKVLLKNLKTNKGSKSIEAGVIEMVNFVNKLDPVPTPPTGIAYPAINLRSQNDDTLLKTYSVSNGLLKSEIILYYLSGSNAKIPATDKEIIETVIKEAKLRGIPPGLALALGMQETKLQHYDKNGKVIESWVGRAGGYGIFQIAESAHPEIKCDLAKVDCNIKSGLNILKTEYDRYRTKSRHFYGCNNGKFLDVDKDYNGWLAAVRAYNGWPSSYRCPISVSNNNRAGDPDYVTHVLKQYNDLPLEYKKYDDDFGFGQ